jgi:predicted HTH transcriptional regulator
MDLDEEILRRLENTEDHFTERKESPQREQVSAVIVAFANSALPNKPGILYIGVNDKGKIIGGENLDSWQKRSRNGLTAVFLK